MAVCKELTWNILKESWLRGKSVVEQAGRAMGMTAALREFEKSILRTWESFTGSGLRFQCTKSHHTQTSWCYSYCIPNIKPLLNQRQCQTSVLSGLRKKRSGLLLSLLWDKSKFWISFANQGPWRKNGKIQNPRCLCSLWWFVMACHLLVLVTVFHQVQSQRRRPPGDFYSTSCWPSTCPQSTGLLTMLSLCLVDQLPHLTNALQIICGALSQTEEKHPNPKYRWWRALSQSLGLQ